MPMGLVSDEEFEKELSKTSRTKTQEEESSGVIIDRPSRGRKEGDVEVPDSLRKVIAEDHLMNGRSSAVALAKEFGVSSSSVSAYAQGATSTASYKSPSQSLIAHINRTREKAVKKASKTLNAALGAISQEKLDYADAKDLAMIAKNMSAIIKDLEPPQVVADESKSSPQFIVYAPQFRKEESFEVIDLRAEEGK